MKYLCLVIIAGATIALTGCSKKDSVSSSADTIVTAAVPLKAAFTIVDQEYVKEGTPAQFRNTSTGAAIYKWDFGTGDFSTEKEPVYTFPGCGPHNIVLLATDAAGNQKSVTLQLEVRCTGKHVQQGG